MWELIATDDGSAEHRPNKGRLWQDRSDRSLLRRVYGHRPCEPINPLPRTMGVGGASPNKGQTWGKTAVDHAKNDETKALLPCGGAPGGILVDTVERSAVSRLGSLTGDGRSSDGSHGIH